MRAGQERKRRIGRLVGERIGIFDFELTEDEMTKMAALNRQQRFENW